MKESGRPLEKIRKISNQHSGMSCVRGGERRILVQEIEIVR